MLIRAPCWVHVKPAVGLMSIGEEEVKGNDLTKEAFPLLRKFDELEFRRQRRRA